MLEWQHGSPQRGDAWGSWPDTKQHLFRMPCGGPFGPMSTLGRCTWTLRRSVGQRIPWLFDHGSSLATGNDLVNTSHHGWVRLSHLSVGGFDPLRTGHRLQSIFIFFLVVLGSRRLQAQRQALWFV